MKAKYYIQELCDTNPKEWKGMQNLNTNEWLEIMEDYAEERVKNSSIPNVSGTLTSKEAIDYEIYAKRKEKEENMKGWAISFFILMVSVFGVLALISWIKS